MNYKNAFGTLWVIIAVVIIGLAALFAFGILDVANFKGEKAPESQTDIQLEQINNYSQSDNVDSIDKDLEETSLDGLDQEIEEIDQELQGF